jgi:two-component sensor histidine kinase
MQARHIGNDDVVGVFEETRNRVQSIASIHELLYRGESFAGIQLSPYARQLAPDLIRFYGLEGRVAVDVVGDGASLELERAVPYGIVLNELVSNACKHAFPEGRSGQITITIWPIGDEVEMSIADNGKGLPPGFDDRRSSSLGLQLVHALARQLRGTVEMRSESGAVVSLRFPGAAAPKEGE